MGEMLDSEIFKRPRRGWRATILIKDLLSDDEDLEPEQIRAIGEQIASRLRACNLFDDEEILWRFEQADSYDVFNEALDDMYSACDDTRIWVE